MYRHLGFQKHFSGDDTPDPLLKGKGSEGKEGEGKGPYQIVSPGPPNM